MNPHNGWRDREPEALSTLPTHEPDQGRAVQTRARCHAALRKRARRSRITEPAPTGGWRRALTPAIVGSLCALYLLEVIARARELYRF